MAPAGQRVRDAALQAMGLIVTGSPQLMLAPLQLGLLPTGAVDSDEAAVPVDSSSAGGAAALRSSDRGSPAASGTVQDADVTAAAAAHSDVARARPQRYVQLPARCAADVYAAALAGCVPLGVKSRVLSGLLELLR